MVMLTQDDYNHFSGAVKEYLKKLSELRNEGYAEEAEKISQMVKEGDDPHILPSLKYSFPAVPKPKEKARPLTNDQKQQNAMFMRECKRVWREAQEELRLRVIEAVRRAERAGDATVESERKSKADSARGSAAPTPAEGRSTARFEVAALNDLSLKRLKEWIEIDEDKKAEEERKSLKEKQFEAKKNHEEFVKKKDR